MNTLNTVSAHCHGHARTHIAVLRAAIEHEVETIGQNDLLLAAQFTRVKPHRSGDDTYPFRIFLKAQQIENTDSLVRVQPGLQQFGSDLKWPKQTDHSCEQCHFPHKKDEKGN